MSSAGALALRLKGGASYPAPGIEAIASVAEAGPLSNVPS
jgi:hypothetical protein